MSSFTDRIIRASKLDVSLYEEVEADKGAMGQAMAIVVLSSLAAGIGSLSAGGLKGIVFRGYTEGAAGAFGRANFHQEHGHHSGNPG